MNCCIIKKYSRNRCTNKSTRLFNFIVLIILIKENIYYIKKIKKLNLIY